MKLRSIPVEELRDIEIKSGGLISFETINSAITKITFPGPNGDLIVSVGSYTVSLCELAKKEVFYFSYMETVRGEKILLEKEFDSEYDRTSYIQSNFSDVPEDEIYLDSRKVVA